MAEKKKNGSSLLVTTIIGIIIFVLGGLMLLITYNPGNINNTVLKNIPFINNFVPKEEAKTDVSLEDKYYDYSKPRLKEAVFSLEKEKVLFNEQIKNMTTQIADRDKEIARLKQFEDMYTTLKKEKESFANAVANQDKKAFAAYYEKVSPEVAKQIYTEITKSSVVDAATKKYIETLDAMDVTLVAKMLDDMIRTDFDRVVKILQNMDQDKSVLVLQSMDPKNTTKITQKLTGGIK